jgi:acyl carrier protein
MLRDLFLESNIDRLGDDDDLFDTMLTDSMAVLELLRMIHIEFGVRLRLGEVKPGTLRSINTLTTTIECKL